MSATYIVSMNKNSAVVYSGKMHHMSIRAAANRYADDAFVVYYCGNGHIADDVLKTRSNGPCHLSKTELDLISKAK